MNKCPIGFLNHFLLIFKGFRPPFWLHFVIEFPYKNALQISSIFASIFGCILTSFWLHFGSQNRSQNGSRPPLGHRKPPEACPGAWGPSKGMQNGAQIQPRTLKIHPLGNDFNPKRLPRWIQATLGAHGTTRSMPRSPLKPQPTTSMEPKLNSMYAFINFRLELYS